MYYYLQIIFFVTLYRVTNRKKAKVGNKDVPLRFLNLRKKAEDT